MGIVIPEDPDLDEVLLGLPEGRSTRMASPLGSMLRCLPKTPSPLGLSNYDAIELEGDPYLEDEQDELESICSVKSNFQHINGQPTEAWKVTKYQFMVCPRAI